MTYFDRHICNEEWSASVQGGEQKQLKVVTNSEKRTN